MSLNPSACWSPSACWRLRLPGWLSPCPSSQTLIAPEAASGWIDKPGWQGRDFMVAAANPLAVDAGYQIIKAGAAPSMQPSPSSWC